MTHEIILTELEKQVIKQINQSEYGSEMGDPVWSWSISGKVKGKQLSGVVSSLVKKGLVGSDDKSDKDACTWLTKEGVAYCIANPELAGNWIIR